MKQAADQRQLLECPRISIGGIRVDAVDADGIRDLLRVLLQEPSCHQVVTVNLDYLRQGVRDPRLRQIINTATLVVPDGMPVVWAARLSGARVRQRITGHDLTQALAELSAHEGFSLFFLGAAPGVGQLAARNLKQRYPSIRIAGVYSPPLCPYPFPEKEDRRMLEAINAAQPDALLVALGCPKQDLWIAAHREELKASLAIGVGCVFDVLAGTYKRAPQWVQAAGMEWLYRLYQEPRRLWRRYLLHDLPFLLRLFLRGRLGSSGGG